MKPVISIIVPIYNVEEYLAACLDSILKQTFSYFELILVNDGSMDACGEICNEYAMKDSRIKVIHKDNAGVSSARNKGLEVSEGDYIAFVDPDDTVEQTMYEILLESARKHKAEMVVCPIKTVNFINNTTRISQIWKNADYPLNKRKIEEYIIPSILQNKNYSLVSSVNKLYKRSLFEKSNIRFDESKHHGEDARLNFKLLTLINNLVYVEQPLYNYYLRKRNSLTQIFREDLFDYIVDNRSFLIEMSKLHGLEIYIRDIRSHFLNVTLSYINKVVCSTLNRRNKYSILTSILNDKTFYEDILKYRGPSHYYRLLKIMCILKNERILYIFVKLKVTLQYYLNDRSVRINR